MTALLRKLKTETEIQVVLVTSAGPEFCTGVDLSTLIHEKQEDRKEMARTMSNVIQYAFLFSSLSWALSTHLIAFRDFILELANCDKILVGGLNGSAVGLGVMMLRYFDLVYASDKSTFYLPYFKLAQGTEGAASLALQNTSTAKSLVRDLL